MSPLTTRTPSALLPRLLPRLACLVAPLCALLLFACAPRQVLPTAQPVPERDALATWQAYEDAATAREKAQGPFRINLSLRYGPENDTRRVTAILWGNGDLPVRLDVSAGVGALVARIREDQRSLVAFSPRENKALTHNGPNRVLLNFGVPLPFGLADFSALIRGEFTRVFGPLGHGQPVYGAENTLVFPLEARQPEAAGERLRLGGLVFLTPAGLPVRWDERPADARGEASGWVMRLEYDDDAPGLPTKITLNHPGGQQAILLVKSRQTPAAPFSPGQLGLPLPQGVEMQTLKPARTF